MNVGFSLCLASVSVVCVEQVLEVTGEEEEGV